MRLRTFTGKTVAHVMELIRSSVGEDAVIVNIDERRGQAQITVAIERKEEVFAEEQHSVEHLEETLENLPLILRFHGVPLAVAKKLEGIAKLHAHQGINAALSAALEENFSFRPIATNLEERLMLIGLTGQGKTLTAARLATMAKRFDRPARIITMDIASAGALAQLEAFCKPIGVEVVGVMSRQEAERACAKKFPGLTLIDTPGINPYDIDDVQALAAVPKRLKAEPIWVFAANTDSIDAVDMGEIFSSMGTRRVIITRADASRRFAGVLAVLARCRMGLAAISASPFVSVPLEEGSARALAERLIDRPDPQHISRFKKANAA